MQLAAITALHGLGYMHRDIKPHNLCTAMTPIIDGRLAVSVKLIDFGTVRKWRTSDGSHSVDRGYCPVVVGTTRYNSKRAHGHKDKSRACDLWGLLYVALEMLAPNRLPWRALVDDAELRLAKQDADHAVGCLPANISSTYSARDWRARPRRSPTCTTTWPRSASPTCRPTPPSWPK